MIKYHNEDLTRSYVTTAEGIKLSMPRYFKEKIFDEKSLRKVNKIIKAVQWAEFMELTPEQETLKDQYIASTIRNTEKMLKSKRNKI